MSFNGDQSQPSESDGNGKTSLENLGRDPNDETLNDVIKGLLSSFDELSLFKKVKKNIEKKCGISKQPIWQAEEIKKAWQRKQLKHRNSSRQRWTKVILLQELKRRQEICKEQSNRMDDFVQRSAQLSLREKTCGEVQNTSGNTGESPQSNDKLDTVAVNQKNGASSTAIAPYSEADSSAPRHNPVRSASVKPTDNTPTNILIPLLKMPRGILDSTGQTFKSSLFKLIDGYPCESHSDIRIRKSYVMSYNKETKNAEWVYEILNENTVKKNCKDTRSFGKNELKGNKDHDQGRNEFEGVDHDQGRMELEGNDHDHDQGRNEFEGDDHDQGRMELEGNDHDHDKERNEFEGNVHDHGRKKSKGNDYDQGHLAAAANHRWCQEAYHDTYLISNMVPQDKTLNKAEWKTIENYCRDKAKNAVCNVHVYTGPLYLKENKHKTYYENEDKYDRADPSEMQRLGGKAVPTHFFKVIIAENKDGTVEEPECYVVPKLDKEDNESKAYSTKKQAVLDMHTERIKTIQELSGLKFIDSHQKVETDRIETITWTGEGETGELCSATITVRISSV